PPETNGRASRRTIGQALSRSRAGGWGRSPQNKLGGRVGTQIKAIRVHEKGGPEVMRFEDAPDPEVGAGEVLIRVRAIGVNFADHLMRIGAYPAGDPPIIPGLEAAGVVERVGENVSGVAPGQPVMAWVRRSYAELAVAPSWA